jgi:hypothetical protein
MVSLAIFSLKTRSISSEPGHEKGMLTISPMNSSSHEWIGGWLLPKVHVAAVMFYCPCPSFWLLHWYFAKFKSQDLSTEVHLFAREIEHADQRNAEQESAAFRILKGVSILCDDDETLSFIEQWNESHFISSQRDRFHSISFFENSLIAF